MKNRRSVYLVGLTVFATLLAGGTAHAQEEQEVGSSDDDPSEPPAQATAPRAYPRGAQRRDIEQPVPRSSTPDPEPVPRSTSRSYGGQIVLADLGALVVGGTLSAFTVNGVPLVVAWTLASPIVHGVHGNPGRAVGSAFLHLGLPVVGALVGVLAPCSNTGDSDVPCGLVGGLVGITLGMVGATVIDAAFLARSSGTTPAHVTVRDDASVLPAISLERRGRLALTWRGRF